MRQFNWVFLLLWYVPMLAQHHEPHVVGADAAGLGYTSLTRTHSFATINNQGALPFVDQFSIGVFAQRTFWVDGLDYIALSAVVPTEVGSFGFATNHFGYERYSEQQFRLAYGRKLARNFGLGVSFSGLRTQMAEYGSAFGATVEIGMLYQLNEAVTVAAHTFNPLQRSIIEESQPIPSTMALGVKYQSTESVQLYLDAVKNWQQPLSIRGGIEYVPTDKLVIRAGTMTQPLQFTFGLGVKADPLCIDLAYAYHPVLGSTPMISLQFIPGQSATLQ